jgi:hypothetical protein
MSFNNSDYVDLKTLNLKIISQEHHEIHEEKHFYLENFLELDSDGIVEFAFQTANIDTLIHMVFDFQSQAEITIEKFENSTITFDGTPIVPINNYRESSNLTTMLNVQEDPDVTADGDDIGRICTGDITTPVIFDPGKVNREKEIVFKRNANYLYRITSKADNNIISYLFSWYEHKRKDI